MHPLPSREERDWLVDALKRLIASRGVALLDSAPLVEPTNEWFPEPWNTTAAHGHRLAQRLMHYAGLGALRLTLSAYEPQWNDDGTEPWDAGTAGWFTGIENGRAHFGLHVAQFSDPEAAAGVLAHEVAHAWRDHHRLIIDDREEEELLTDVTTIVLGFGILSTNNTDRYRSTGDWSMTSWSNSSVGYLPPQAMSYLLALWCAARGRPGEAKTIEKHLEPNQRGFFRAALEDIEQSGVSPRLSIATSAPSRMVDTVRPDAFQPKDPHHDEIDEPDFVEASKENVGRMVYRKAKGSAYAHLYMGILGGLFFGFLVGIALFGDDIAKVGTFAGACAAAYAAFLLTKSRASVCSECETPVEDNVAVCKGCGGTLGRRVTERELRQIREEELDRLAARDVDYDECDACEPEHPCDEHAAAQTFQEFVGRPELVENEPEEEERIAPPRKPNYAWLAFATLVLIALAAATGVAWWRRSHVPVYFDNATGQPLTLTLDGEAIPFGGRIAIERKLEPGTHSIVVARDGKVIERFDAKIPAQTPVDVLLHPRFFVYNAGGAAIYERATLVYSTVASEQTYEAQLVGLDRWFSEPMTDYVFHDPPDEVSSPKATKTLFHIARDVNHRNLAAVWLGEGREDDALRAVQKGLELEPCDDDLHNDRLEILNRTRKRDELVSAAFAWMSSCDSIESHRTYQNIERRTGNRDALVARYRDRLQRDPSAVNHYLYGRLLHGAPAMSAFQMALRIDPTLTRARVAIGVEHLESERDAEAFEVLEEVVRAEEAATLASLAFAMAAVGAEKIDDALAVLNEADLDDEERWAASWILVRAKRDWSAAKRLLVELEAGKPTPETKRMRARLRWEEGDPRPSILADLKNDAGTTSAANQFALEDALEHGRFADAAAIADLPTLYRAYAAHAALLAGKPASTAHLNDFGATLIDAANGTIDEPALFARAAEEDIRMRAHAWFAVGVRAATTGDRARASSAFRKAAERALDREFPYAVALAMADRYEASGAKISTP